MLEQLSGMSEWVIGFAHSDWTVLILMLTSFIESIFFPVPPDPLLIAISLLRPSLAITLAILTTISSVAGAMAGHYIGGHLGKPLVYRFLAKTTVCQVEQILNRYGLWATVVAAFTPIPDKNSVPKSNIF